ncbi:hypothetical protein CBR_g39511 [Chara braunii]|uniref:Uncharacterized protein n=1 Tax=Chara braunii TaxID=69332 RepID=A0A388LRV9_CHABU|nr:hypothetical protein CBR_g39511 [Chara braunii]|eukprot:GBG85047.1 hypothetical protein CBR_g39511 [Chara braunii]
MAEYRGFWGDGGRGGVFLGCFDVTAAVEWEGVLLGEVFSHISARKEPRKNRPRDRPMKCHPVRDVTRTQVEMEMVLSVEGGLRGYDHSMTSFALPLSFTKAFRSEAVAEGTATIETDYGKVILSGPATGDLPRLVEWVEKCLQGEELDSADVCQICSQRTESGGRELQLANLREMNAEPVIRESQKRKREEEEWMYEDMEEHARKRRIADTNMAKLSQRQTSLLELWGEARCNNKTQELGADLRTDKDRVHHRPGAEGQGTDRPDLKEPRQAAEDRRANLESGMVPFHRENEAQEGHGEKAQKTLKEEEGRLKAQLEARIQPNRQGQQSQGEERQVGHPPRSEKAEAERREKEKHLRSSRAEANQINDCKERPPVKQEIGETLTGEGHRGRPEHEVLKSRGPQEGIDAERRNTTRARPEGDQMRAEPDITTRKPASAEQSRPVKPIAEGKTDIRMQAELCKSRTEHGATGAEHRRPQERIAEGKCEARTQPEVHQRRADHAVARGKSGAAEHSRPPDTITAEKNEVKMQAEVRQRTEQGAARVERRRPKEEIEEGKNETRTQPEVIGQRREQGIADWKEVSESKPACGAPGRPHEAVAEGKKEVRMQVDAPPRRIQHGLVNSKPAAVEHRRPQEGMETGKSKARREEEAHQRRGEHEEGKGQPLGGGAPQRTPREGTSDDTNRMKNQGGICQRDEAQKNSAPMSERSGREMRTSEGGGRCEEETEAKERTQEKESCLEETIVGDVSQEEHPVRKEIEQMQSKISERQRELQKDVGGWKLDAECREAALRELVYAENRFLKEEAKRRQKAQNGRLGRKYGWKLHEEQRRRAEEEETRWWEEEEKAYRIEEERRQMVQEEARCTKEKGLQEKQSEIFHDTSLSWKVKVSRREQEVWMLIAHDEMLAEERLCTAAEDRWDKIVGWREKYDNERTSWEQKMTKAEDVGGRFWDEVRTSRGKHTRYIEAVERPEKEKDAKFFWSIAERDCRKEVKRRKEEEEERKKREEGTWSKEDEKQKQMKEEDRRRRSLWPWCRRARNPDDCEYLFAEITFRKWKDFKWRLDVEAEWRCAMAKERIKEERRRRAEVEGKLNERRKRRQDEDEERREVEGEGASHWVYVRRFNEEGERRCRKSEERRLKRANRRREEEESSPHEEEGRPQQDKSKLDKGLAWACEYLEILEETRHVKEEDSRDMERSWRRALKDERSEEKRRRSLWEKRRRKDDDERRHVEEEGNRFWKETRKFWEGFEKWLREEEERRRLEDDRRRRRLEQELVSREEAKTLREEQRRQMEMEGGDSSQVARLLQDKEVEWQKTLEDRRREGEQWELEWRKKWTEVVKESRTMQDESRKLEEEWRHVMEKERVEGRKRLLREKARKRKKDEAISQIEDEGEKFWKEERKGEGTQRGVKEIGGKSGA